jgi:hypothetical protein
MEYEKAIEILKRLLSKNTLDADEKEAVTTAMGLLSVGALVNGQIRARKAKREKSIEW